MVTVIMPTYNRAAIISESINSVLRQSYENFELLIVDDGSTDNTESVIKAHNDPRLTYIKLPSNKGACYARNIGIKRASNDIIAFQDSDDLWDKDFLLKQLEVFDKVSVNYDAQICKFSFGNKNNTLPVINAPEEGIDLRSLYKRNLVSTQTLVVKKDVLLDIGGFDETLPAFQDWDLALRILLGGYKINILDKVLVFVSWSKDSISLNSKKRERALKIIFEKNKEYLINHKACYYNFSYAAARILQDHSKKGRWKYIKQCFLIDKFELRNIKLLIRELKKTGKI